VAGAQARLILVEGHVEGPVQVVFSLARPRGIEPRFPP
jgi:hypothetical protein